MIMKNLFLGVLIIGVVIFLGAGCIKVDRQDSIGEISGQREEVNLDIAQVPIGFNKYVNETLGVSFLYPEEFNKIEVDFSEQDAMDFIIYLTKPGLIEDYPGGMLEISVDNKPYFSSLDEDLKVEGAEKVNYGGREGVLVSILGEVGGWGFSTEIKERIVTFADVADLDKNTYEVIISSFKIRNLE
ncbi:MAG: hypothetical protein PHD51_01570 [Patescibacteria group bacterium]|nr:hypothetical protein [Patescibacteria group bacterium]MDD5490449.1 hypothetical protein [Patescibacteria group bacterium]